MAFSCKDVDVATRGFMTRTAVEVRVPISEVTIPLFAEDNGQGWLCATGVLLRVRKKNFILTAAHVFDNRITRPIPLNITDGLNGNPLYPIDRRSDPPPIPDG